MIQCGKKCKHYVEEGWNELSLCEHPKMLDKNSHGKYIYEFKGNSPKWCPLKTRRTK